MILSPGTASTVAIELMGIRKAAYAMYMSQKFTAQEALEYGLVNEVVPYDKLIPRAYEIADFIMALGINLSYGTTSFTRPYSNASCAVNF